ncbi:hypothetical protein E4K72_09085 [Oxalobacteraceae bacterium OM1]|nr:hypothetical protein E4K72_09085 [Oxalobacteraceae bacterium OM1]
MLQADGRLDDAARDYEEVIRLRREPEIYDLFILADIYAGMQRYRQAHATLDHAHELVGQLSASRHPALFQRIEFFRQKITSAELASGAKPHTNE